MMYSNKLYAWFGNQGLEMPEIIIERVEGTPDHNPLYEAYLEQGQNLFIGQGAKKKIAKNDVCRQVLDFVTEEAAPKLPSTVTPKKRVTVDGKSKDRLFLVNDFGEKIDTRMYQGVVMIDAENVKAGRKQIEHLTSLGFLVLAFTAKNCLRGLDLFEDKVEHFHLLVSERVGRDAADFLLAFTAGKISVIDPERKVFIVTKDHYGEHLETFLENGAYVCKLDECVM